MEFDIQCLCVIEILDITGLADIGQYRQPCTFFQAIALFSLESAKFWPFLSQIDTFFLQALKMLWCTKIDKYQV